MLTKNEIQSLRLLRNRSEREQAGLFVVEGEKMCAEALDSSFEVERLYLTDRSLLPRTGNCVEVSEKDMERISNLKTPSPSLATVLIPRSTFDCSRFGHELIIALDGVQDPGNMGTIIRLADWFGVANVICSDSSADRFNPKVVQATMGALFRVDVHYGDLCGWLDCALREGAEVCGTMLEGDDLYSVPIDGNCVLVMGSEGHGVSDEVAERFSRRLNIPPYPAIRQGSESLNVAVATAVAVAELRRRIR